MKQAQINALNIYQNVEPDSTFDFIQKGKKAEIGSVHTWSDGCDYKKTIDGWVKVSEVTFKDYKLNLKISTEDQFFHNGSWDKNRVEKVHKPIVDEFLQKVTTTVKNPVVTLMMGAPASGKGLVVRYLQATEEDYKDIPVLNPDHIKTEGLSQDYKEYQKYNIKNAAHKVHEEGSHISKQIIRELDKKKVNYIQDKCFDDYDKLMKEINRLSELNIKVKVMMVSLPVEIAYQRMIERGKRTGRFVVKSTFYRKHHKVEKTFKKLIKNIPDNVVLIRQYNTEHKVELLKQIEK